jgi:hypothetical protein
MSGERAHVPPAVQERMTAAFDLIHRTGAQSAGIRYQDDEPPTVWIALASYDGDRHEAAAALDPLRAVLRLCEQLVDGGVCTHCRRPSGLEPDSIETMPLNDLVCWYQYDPELKTFRRGCE